MDAGVDQLCSGQMVDSFQRCVVDRHPETIVVLAGINDVHSIWGWSGSRRITRLCDRRAHK
jgi:hypothetical protein